MTPPTDLRAALREALQMAADALPLIPETSVRDAFARLVALTDAPPTVAELLPMVDATHEVYFIDRGGDKRRIVRGESGGLTLLGDYGPGGEWLPSELLIDDLTQPARLVEVLP